MNKIFKSACLVVVIVLVLSLCLSLSLPVMAADSNEVLILSNDHTTEVKSYFESNMTGLTFSTFSIGSTAPTLAYLQGFDAVLLFEDGSIGLSDEVGDVLYEYVMGGGNVVFGTFYWQDRSDSGYGGDSWGNLESIDPFTGPGCDYGSGTLDASSIVEHPLTDGVNSLWVGNYQGAAQAKPGTKVVAEWDDGDPLIGYVELDDGQRLIAVTCFPAQPVNWLFTGDFYTIWENALKWACEPRAEEAHASFTASPTMGDAPLTVQFKSQSSGDVDDYYWSFGDGEHSTSKHPSHTYQNEGSYTVTLRVSGDGGTDSFTIYNAIVVESQTVPPNLVVRDLNVSSTYVQPGEAVGVTARVYNDGGSWGSDTMNLLVNGATENSAGVGVAPGTAQTVSFTLYRTTPGEYQVTFGGATATFFVMEEAQQATPASGLLAGGELDTGGIIAIVCIAVIIVAGVVIAFLFARRT